MLNFQEGYYVLVAQTDFFEGEKLCLHWKRPRRIVKAVNDFVLQVEDFRNENVDPIHGSRIKFYSDSSLNQKAIMFHVVNHERGMPVSWPLRLVKQNTKLHVVVRWMGLCPQEGTL